MKKHNVILYPLHEVQRQSKKAYFNMMAAPLAFQSMMVNAMESYGLIPKEIADNARNILDAGVEMSERMARDYTKPTFDLNDTVIGGKKVHVTEEVIDDKPFGSLLHFKRDTDRNDPKVLIIAPMSGHFATLLRDTVAQLLPHHDVYITDWKDAKGVPLGKGEFGLDDYITYVKDFLETVGTDTHVVAVCQPTVPTLAAIARLAEEKSEYQPLSMTLMGGPIDTRRAATQVTELAQSKSIDWFETNMIGQVPQPYEGEGRFVYPGFVQLMSFMSMNLEKHIKSHIELFDHLSDDEKEKADKIKKFYDEYLAVSDLPAKFYLETVQKVFIDQELAKGTLTHDGKKVDTAAIKKTALLTVEGEKDDIAAPGQTTAAHDLCSGLAAGQKYHYLQPEAGHYGIFSGRLWREEITPRITGFIRDIAGKRGVHYDAVPDAKENSITPAHYAPAKAAPAKKQAKPHKFG